MGDISLEPCLCNMDVPQMILGMWKMSEGGQEKFVFERLLSTSYAAYSESALSVLCPSLRHTGIDVHTHLVKYESYWLFNLGRRGISLLFIECDC